jgi:hypothetical protein
MDAESAGSGPEGKGALHKGAEGKGAGGLRGRRRTRSRREGWNLIFESVGTSVPASMVVNSPTLLQAAVEELCWRFALNSLLAGRPRRWRRRAYAAWSAQLAEFESKRQRLRRLVEAELLEC